ncbi:MAG: hypothetical protein N3F05_02975 [Candidatus Diapherotrites archaeon]|nr:hypothetical protein [Candidatus Diapherotrites archaeon]
MRNRKRIRRQLPKHSAEQKAPSPLKRKKEAARAGYILSALASKLYDPIIVKDLARWNSALVNYTSTTISIGALRHFNAMLTNLKALMGRDYLKNTWHSRRIAETLEQLERLRPYFQQVSLAENQTELKKRFAAKLSAIHSLNAELQSVDPKSRIYFEMLLIRAQKI